MAFLFRIYPPSYPPTTVEVAFVWDTSPSATSYVLQIGTESGLSDIFNQNVGYVLTYPVSLTPRYYYSRVIPYIGSSPQTPTAEQMVAV